MSAFSAAAQNEDGDIIKNLQARVADLEAQLYAVGAGGVGSPVARQDHPEQHLDMVPEGWKLVPVEPADSQIRAAQDTWWHACNCETYWDQIYAAMIAAAPQPPAVKESLTADQPQSVTNCHQSQPQGGQEPVAYYVERHAPGMRDHSTKLGPFWKREDAEGWLDEHHQMHALYTHPQPRQPLTNEQVKAGLIDSIDFADQRERCAFSIGVRFAERAHGIGGDA